MSETPLPLWRLPGMFRLLATLCFALMGLGLLLPISPEWVLSGGGDEFHAGLVTAVLMGATVATQLAMTRLLRRFGWTTLLAAGVTLLGAPSLVQALSPDLWTVLGTSALRGIGFGILTVSGSTALALLAPPARRARAVGLYGVAIAIPQFIFATLSPVLASLLSTPVVIACGVVTVFGLIWAVPLGRQLNEIDAGSRRESAAQPTSSTRPTPTGSALRRIATILPAMVAVTAAGGALISFATQIGRIPVLATTAIFLLTGIAILTRGATGVIAERRGTMVPTVVSLVLGALGTAAIALSHIAAPPVLDAVALLGGAALLGCSYGAVQTLTLVRAFDLAGPGNSAQASVAWNVSFDLGTGSGSLLLGWFALLVSFSFGWWMLTLMLVIAALVFISPSLGSRRSS